MKLEYQDRQTYSTSYDTNGEYIILIFFFYIKTFNILSLCYSYEFWFVSSYIQPQ